MAGLLYLPRLFVYHAENGVGSPQAETFKVMERRLYKAIMTPAMLASWLFGLALIWSLGVDFSTDLWIWVKLVFVLALTGFHGHLGKVRRQFEQDQSLHSAKYFRLINRCLRSSCWWLFSLLSLSRFDIDIWDCDNTAVCICR